METEADVATVMKGRGEEQGPRGSSTGNASHSPRPEKQRLTHHRGTTLYLCFPQEDPIGPFCHHAAQVLLFGGVSQITPEAVGSTMHALCTVALRQALLLKLIGGYQGSS